jgi:hypothetical protein
VSAVAMRESGNVLDALASRARASSNRSLIALTLGGIGASAAVILFIVDRWLLVFPGFAVAAYGMWGLIDAFITTHVLCFSNAQRAMLRRLQKTVAAMGVIAAFGALFVFFGKVLGAFIS